MQNIEYFNKIVYNVMIKIMENFPDNVSVDIDDLLPENECIDRDKAPGFCYNTMEWLQKNNYIIVRSEELPVTSWDMIMPTDKLMALMNIKLPKIMASGRRL